MIYDRVLAESEAAALYNESGYFRFRTFALERGTSADSLQLQVQWKPGLVVDILNATTFGEWNLLQELTLDEHGKGVVDVSAEGVAEYFGLSVSK